jgi:hypothetical protein
MDRERWIRHADNDKRRYLSVNRGRWGAVVFLGQESPLMVEEQLSPRCVVVTLWT